jgi:hypothetical protein
MFHQDFNKIYMMVKPIDRIEIINKIENEEIMSESGEKWWLNKHHPNNDIPKNIYLLGKGSIKELYEKYNENYENINWGKFINYTRELIKQKIMV